MKLKTICMIPARLGSKRVPRKNLRLINGKPLVAYIIEAAKVAGCFDEIYLNSEDEIFKNIAEKYGIKFYKRHPQLADDEATNDAFMMDFLQNTKCDKVVQLLPTSPFINSQEIREFTQKIKNDIFQTVVSVKNVQIECLYENHPLNFSPTEITKPSQQVQPVKAYACALMGWDRKKYIENMQSHNAAYHGGTGTIGFFELKGFSLVDIDTEEDFALAEVIMKSLYEHAKHPEYYSEKARDEEEYAEADVPAILKKDGVIINNLDDTNHEIRNIYELINSYLSPIIGIDGKKSWSYRLVNTESNSATLICQNPGEGNRLHYHPNWNEWWLIMQGEWIFEIEGTEKRVKKGDLVFIPKMKKHKITATGTEQAIRLAVSREDVQHIYDNV